MVIAQQIKATPGITGWWAPIVHIGGLDWHLDVDSSYPGAVEGSKGSAVRRVKRYVSWVKYDVSQYGPYLLMVWKNLRNLTLVREERCRRNL